MQTLYIASNNIGDFSENSNCFQQPYHLSSYSRCTVCVPHGTSIPRSISSRAENVIFASDSVIREILFRNRFTVSRFIRRHGLENLDCVISDFSDSSVMLANSIRVSLNLPWYVVLWDPPFSNRYDLNRGLRYKAERAIRLRLYNSWVKHAKAVYCYIDSGCLLEEGIKFRKVVQLVNGVDDEFIGRIRSSGSERKVPFSICVVGRVRVDKGSLNILKALELLEPKFPNITLTFVGQLDGAAGAESMITVEDALESERLRDRVKVTGRLPFIDAMKAVVSHEVGLHAYSDERYLFWNQVLKIGEYQALGTVPIAVSYPGTQHLIEDGITGLFIETNSPEHIAEAIATLFSNRVKMRSIGKAAMKVVHSRSWKAVTSRMFEHITHSNDSLPK